MGNWHIKRFLLHGAVHSTQQQQQHMKQSTKNWIKDIGMALLLTPVYLGAVWLLVYTWMQA